MIPSAIPDPSQILAQREALARIDREVAAATPAEHPPHGWSGPAADAYRSAVVRLHRELSSARHALWRAENATDAAVIEVTMGVAHVR
ncbi:hypothetical protein [Galbitalea soli]|uniref:Uncharacterized protein n=1 Tax=Galbitalea soli TaxID=1268042 RepID=A0A7C9TS81_9MICO|nr:hypothetical protein [Galbitalea soli]NEM91784.1 hypothetical protein [Galbitalea soli]NYJ29383.1 uncharacterized protein YukE [Galbitalea soli]